MLKVVIPESQEQLLYVNYLALQSEEFKEDIIRWEPLKMKEHDIAIKVIFSSFWLRVYRTSNRIEWY